LADEASKSRMSGESLVTVLRCVEQFQRSSRIVGGEVAGERDETFGGLPR